MKILTLTLRLFSLIGLTALFGMMAPAQAGVSVVITPPAVVVGTPAVVVAPPAPVVVAPAFDVYIGAAAPTDIVFFRGDTFIWAVDEHGHRYRRFYAHGDHRQELYHRRDELHRVGAHGGRPDHHEEVRHEEHREAEHREEHR